MEWILLLERFRGRNESAINRASAQVAYDEQARHSWLLCESFGLCQKEIVRKRGRKNSPAIATFLQSAQTSVLFANLGG